MLKNRSLIVPRNQQPYLLPHFWRLYSTLNNRTDSSALSPFTNVAQFDISTIDFDSITETAASPSPNNSQKCIKSLLSDVSKVVPDTVRRLRRASSIRVEDILELLIKFQSECETSGVKRKYAESMWEIFRLSNEQSLKHYPSSWETMSSILLRHGMLREIQSILFATEKQGIEINTRHLLCQLMEGYVNSSDSDRALLSYEQMKDRGLNPSLPCYCSLIETLAHSERSAQAFKVCSDMLSQETTLNEEGKTAVENVARFLLKKGVIQEARNLVRKSLKTGARLSSPILNEIASGYCEKWEFEDLIKFLAESKCVLSVASGNKIINSLCSNVGVEKAEIYRSKMEKIGSFSSNERTYAILIGWSCKEGKVKAALIYLSEMVSRNLKPNICSYNALLGGIFSMGLTYEGSAVFDDMLERGVSPSLTTFRVLIAGYCKGRDFELVKRAVREMMKRSMVESSSVSDPLSFAFSLLGMGHLDVRMRRDNSVGLWKVEFYDHLGNGLYLDTNVQQFDDLLTRVLHEAYLPSFNLLIGNKCADLDFPAAFSLANEMCFWGQELSPDVFVRLLKNSSLSVNCTHQCLDYIERSPMILHHFDEETLGFLIKLCSLNGFVHRARMIHETMLLKSFTVSCDSLNSLLSQLSKKVFKGEFIEFWSTCRCFQWTPSLASFESLVKCFCRHQMLPEAVELFKKLTFFHPRKVKELSSMFVDILHTKGYPRAAHVLGRQLGMFGPSAPSEKATCQTHESCLIKELCSRGRIEEAISVLDGVLKEGNEPDPECYDFVVGALCGCDEVERALDFHVEMVEAGMVPRVETWGIVVDALCRRGRTAEAEWVVGWMRRLGGDPSREMYCALMKRYRIENEVNKAAEMMHQMQNSGHDPDFDMHWSLIQRMNCGVTGKSNGFISRLLFGNHVPK